MISKMLIYTLYILHFSIKLVGFNGGVHSHSFVSDVHPLGPWVKIFHETNKFSDAIK